MRGSALGIRYSAAVALVLCCLASVGKAEGLGAPLYYSSLVAAEASLVADTQTSEILKFSDPDSYALPASIVADTSRGDDSASAEAEQSSAVPEPSGIVLGAFFAALFALVSLLRWRFDRTAVQS